LVIVSNFDPSVCWIYWLGTVGIVPKYDNSDNIFIYLWWNV